MRKQITGKQFDEERALYFLQHTDVEDCVFAGLADGESVLKEARNVGVKNCRFSLRYPLWHVQGFHMEKSTMDEKTRAAIWYACDGEIRDSVLGGIKAVRECHNINLTGCEIVSQEFGWKSSNITLKNSSVTAEYLFLDSRDVKLGNVQMKENTPSSTWRIWRFGIRIWIPKMPSGTVKMSQLSILPSKANIWHGFLKI